MKKTTLFLSLITLLICSSSSCKKKGCTDSKATNYDSKAKKDDGSCVLPIIETVAHVETYIVNDTVDFATTGTISDTSVLLGRQGITTDTGLGYYSIESQDSTSNTTGPYNFRHLRLNIVNGARELVNNYVDFELKNFNLGEEINDNSPSLGNTTSSPSHSVAFLFENNSSFSLNSTQYIGLTFEENGAYYNGWLKIKTLNNYHSCVIESYTVSTVEAQAVTITE